MLCDWSSLNPGKGQDQIGQESKGESDQYTPTGLEPRFRLVVEVE